LPGFGLELLRRTEDFRVVRVYFDPSVDIVVGETAVEDSLLRPATASRVALIPEAAVPVRAGTFVACRLLRRPHLIGAIPLRDSAEVVKTLDLPLPKAVVTLG